MTDLSQLRIPDINHRKRVPIRAIRAVARFIAEKFDPDKIILFGSHAYGRPKPWSDVDLLVVIGTPGGERPLRDAIWTALSPLRFSVDIHVRSQATLDRRIALGDWFLKEITTRGKALYERDHGQRGARHRAIPGESDKGQGMNELTAEWVTKAEGDFNAAGLLAKTEAPLAGIVCFHSQQCAEKYLKGFLQQQQIEFQREHFLIPLLEACASADAGFEQLRPDLMLLDKYAVVVRYPGTDCTVEEAHNALNAAGRVRAFVRARLGLPEK